MAVRPALLRLVDAAYQRRRRYRETFGGDAGRWVLADLVAAHHVNESVEALDRSGAVDPIQMAILEGERRAVWRILRCLALTDEEIEQLGQRAALNRAAGAAAGAGEGA